MKGLHSMMEYCAAVKEGRVDIVTNDIEHLLGRSARSYAAWAQDHIRGFL